MKPTPLYLRNVYGVCTILYEIKKIKFSRNASVVVLNKQFKYCKNKYNVSIIMFKGKIKRILYNKFLWMF